jgi:2-polyprenyl-3-methyl-5-hydroxy-6-metoxy-1,4-benzoquinol methylase
VARPSATDWDERYAKADLEWGAEPNRFLVQEVRDLQPGSALDIASGEGRNAIWLAEQGWSVTAVDFSQVGIEKARRLAAERKVHVDWVVADVVAHSPITSFDLVIVFYLHLSAPEMERVLGTAATALRPGGTLLVVGHDRSNLTAGVGGPQDPTILLDADEVASQLDDLVIEKAVRVSRPVEGAERDAIDTLVRAKRP